MFHINLKQLFLFVMVGFFITACDDSNPVTPIEHNIVGGIELYINDTLVHKQFGGVYSNADGVCGGGAAECSINLNPDEEYDVLVHFLDIQGEELEEVEGEEHDDELAFKFCNNDGLECSDATGSESVQFHTEEHCDDITDQTECNASDHCEWHTDDNACESEVDCDDITDQTECNDSDHCEWHTDDNACESEVDCDDITDQTECNDSDHCEWHTDDNACESEENHDGHQHELEFEIITSVESVNYFRIYLMHLLNGVPHPDYTSDPIIIDVNESHQPY